MKAGERVGPYEVLSLIGAGGMGEVWRARDTRLGRNVAIKVLPAEFASDPERLRRFEREARATAAFSHPNILDVHDVGTFEGVPYLVEELLEGESLKERIGRGPIPVREAVGIAVQVAHGLAAAHGKNIVHRDLKPENVFLTHQGTAKILDFGLAKLVANVPLEGADTLTHAPTGATEPGRVLGTVAYMAPEQARGMAVDKRSDIFAFGVVLYEMLAGERPFRGKTATDTLAAIIRDEAAPLPGGVPVQLAEVIGKCLAKEPAQRYGSGREVTAALEALRAGDRVAPWPGWMQKARRRPWLLVATVIAPLVVLAVALNVGGLRGRLSGGSRAHVIRMAVLPFANLSGDPQQEYLSDGMTQEMIAQLGRLHPQSLSVIARTSVMRYKRTEKPIDQIGRELGVDYVLEGGAQREASRIRISAELIQVRDQTQLWADVYERELSGILALQSDVAGKVATALSLKLLPSEQTRLATARTMNAEAYDAYLKGLQSWYRLKATDLDSAESYFNLALERDPSFARAYAGLALVWSGRSQMGIVAPADGAPKGKAAALKAISFDDSLAEAHWALASVMTWSEWNWSGAEPEFKRAIALNPSYADVRAFYSHFLQIVGRPDEAIPQIQKAVRLDPLNAVFQGFYAQNLVWVGRYDEAIAQARKTLKMEPGNRFATMALWMVYELTGAEAEALALAKTDNADDPQLLRAIQEGGAAGGYREAMRRAAETLEERARTTKVRALDVAGCYDSAGDKQRALDWLEKALRAQDPSLPYVVLRNWRNTIGDDPRSQAILRGMNLPAVAEK